MEDDAGELDHPPTRPHANGRSIAPWLWLVTLVVIVTGMAYTLWWPAVVRHASFYWLTPGDVWSQVRVAHFVGWGGLSWVYLRQTALVTVPGFNVLLAPVVMLSSGLGLSEIAPGLPGPPKPTEWLLVGPAVLLCSAVALFGIDALAKRLELSVPHRRLLGVLVGAATWSSMAMWGHPEDVLAIGLAAWALARAFDGRLTSAGWILGAAIAMQFYALLLVPLFMGVVGRRHVPLLLARAAVLPGFLLVAVLAPDFHHAFRTLVEQPSYPIVDHATPWVGLSPVITKGVVEAGPARIGAFVVGAVAGLMVARRRHDREFVIWMMAVVLAGRCIFEAVMVPYYVMPIVVACVFLAAHLGRARLAAAAAAGLGLTIMTFSRSSEWTYFSEMTTLAAALLVISCPLIRLKARHPVVSEESALPDHGELLEPPARQLFDPAGAAPLVPEAS